MSDSPPTTSQSDPADLLIDAEIDTVPMPASTLAQTAASAGTASQPIDTSRLLLLGASLVLIAFNLRPALASLAPVLPEVMRDRGLTPTAMSLLTTLPVLCLGFFAPLAPHLARRWGTERAILILLVVLAAGTALRGLANVPALVAGAILVGAAIGVVNVLLPGLVKRDFPHRAALMTGLYTMALCAGAAGAAGATLPLKAWLGDSWPAALAIWAAPVLLVILIWAPQVPSRRGAAGHAGFIVRGLWRDKLAWQITLFMGLQSALAYSVFGWLVPILRDRGLDPIKAGLAVSVSILCQVAASLIAPSLATLGRDQRLCNAAAIAVSLAGLMGLLFTPLSLVWFWAVLLGLGQGSLIAVALTIIVLRSPDAHVAAHLSSMVQSVGYTLAATGPLLVGPLHSLTGDWRAVGVMFVVLGLGAGWFGLGAGRNLLVGATSHPAPSR
jgi:CP family cyanate transporter-like MFS transporter